MSLFSGRMGESLFILWFWPSLLFVDLRKRSTWIRWFYPIFVVLSWGGSLYQLVYSGPFLTEGITDSVYSRHNLSRKLISLVGYPLWLKYLISALFVFLVAYQLWLFFKYYPIKTDFLKLIAYLTSAASIAAFAVTIPYIFGNPVNTYLWISLVVAYAVGAAIICVGRLKVN